VTGPVLPRARPAYLAIAALLVVIAIVRIISTYQRFNATFDEPAHLATGMQWIDRGQYNIESLHPPLARVFIALGPYIDGIRSKGHQAVWQEAYYVMYSGRSYYRTLTLMRVGVLPFFLLLCWVVWWWTRRLYGDDAALLALALTTFLPPILAHGSVATTDMALTSTLLLTFAVFARWLDEPTRRWSMLLGLAGALAVLSKFSSGPFLIAGGAGVLGTRWWFSNRPTEDTGRRLQLPGVASMLTVIGTTLVVIWAGYRFSIANVGGLPLPAPEFVKGLYKVSEVNGRGLDAYLLGEVSTHGWWYFFPVTLAVKTPIGFLLLAIAGIVFVLRDALRRGDWRVLVPLIGAAAVLGTSMPANINIGVRHVLPVLPLLAIGAAGATMALWHSIDHRRLARGFVAVCGAWLIVSSVRAHPEYITYFNEFAGSRPDRILVNGDLDWGQDLDRLADTLRARNATRVKVAYFGSASPPKHLVGAERLSPFEKPSGYVAVSEAVIKGILVEPRNGFAWADSIAPVARIGKSIRLYHFP
jgi:hypothetical protein